MFVERAAEAADALLHVNLQARAFAHQMLDDTPRGGERQRVPDESSGEECDADFREAVVAIAPRAAVERVHVFLFTCEHADGHAAADDLAVGGHVRLDAEVGLRAAGGTAETGDDLVENERGAGFFGDRADLAHELARLEAGGAALHRLDHHGGEFVGVGPEDFKRSGVRVVEHEHVLDQRLRDAGRDRLGFVNSVHPGTADQDFLEHAVVVAGEIGDAVAAGDGAGQAHGGHHRFRAGVAERGTLHAG